MIKRVLHYVGKMDFGGMESLIMTLYRNINKDEFQFDFAVHSIEKGDYDDEILSLGGRIFYFPIMRNNPIAYNECWEKFWKEHKKEIYAFQMHTNSLANNIAIKTAKSANIPIRIIHAHSAYAAKGRLQVLNDFLHKVNRRYVYKYANRLIACSEEAARWMYGNIDMSKVILLNNAVDYSLYRYDEYKRKIIRSEFGVGERLVLCQIGHLLSVKNHRFTLKVLSYLKKSNLDFICLFVGSGSLEQELREETINYGLSENVIFTGARKDVSDVLSASDIFLMPSLYEGLGIAAVEAQISGIQCVLSSNIPTIVSISDRICFLDINDESKWGEYIQSIIKKDIYNRKNFFLEQTFDASLCTKQYCNLLNREDVVWIEK